MAKIKFSSISYYLLLILTFACNKPCDFEDDETAIQCLNSLPSRDLNSDPETKNYLDNHKVYISLSTSPNNVKKITPMLRTLNLEHIESIFLALPKKYRNEQSYDSVPNQLLTDFPKIKVIAEEQDDIGPIMKMLPAIELVEKLDPDSIVISVDDDVGFPKGAINELIYHSIKHPNAIVSGWGNYAETYGILASEWPTHGKTSKAPFCGSGPLSYCDTVEGWRGIAYKPGLVNTKRMRHIASLSKACKTSDDLVISYVLAESGVEKIRIVNKFFNFARDLDYGRQSGALHNVKLDIPGWKPRYSLDATFSPTTNSERYQRCVLDILN